MSTLPADPDTERLAHKVAQATGKPVSAIVRAAIEASAREAGVLAAETARQRPADKLQRLREIAARSAARPVLDSRAVDEIFGYDERGLPE